MERNDQSTDIESDRISSSFSTQCATTIISKRSHIWFQFDGSREEIHFGDILWIYLLPIVAFAYTRYSFQTSAIVHPQTGYIFDMNAESQSRPKRDWFTFESDTKWSRHWNHGLWWHCWLQRCNVMSQLAATQSPIIESMSLSTALFLQTYRPPFPSAALAAMAMLQANRLRLSV
jgi:hypothetical protein